MCSPRSSAEGAGEDPPPSAFTFAQASLSVMPVEAASFMAASLCSDISPRRVGGVLEPSSTAPISISLLEPLSYPVRTTGYYTEERKRNLAYTLRSLVKEKKKLGETDFIDQRKVAAAIELKFGVSLETALGYLDVLKRGGLIDIKGDRIDVL